MARQTGSDKAQIKQKAGGSGKKGKQFMEDKSQLLSLVSGITESKAATSKAKIDKVKSRIEAHPLATSAEPTKSKGDGGSHGKAKAVKAGHGTEKRSAAGDKKRAERAQALDDAKRAIMEKRRAKKTRRADRERNDLSLATGADRPRRKTVGFA